MQPTSLGLVNVTTPGTPIPLTSDGAKAAYRIRAAVLIGHTGKVYLGSEDLNRSSFSGVVKEFWPTGAGGGIADELVIEAPAGSGNVLRLADYYVDADIAGEGLIVEYWVT